MQRSLQMGGTLANNNDVDQIAVGVADGIMPQGSEVPLDKP